ncbi:MAG: M23 family metallopeptidase [Microbacterium arborescens]
MVRDLTAAFKWLDDLERKVSRIFSGAFLENASVTNGMFRFIGGLLRLDSGARLEGEGHFAWSGPVYLDGDTEITKSLKVAAVTRLLAELIVEGGKITVGGMTIDATAGGSVSFPGGARVSANEGSEGVRIESGAGWTAYVASNGIRFAGGIGQASVTLGPDALSLGGNLVRISGDQVRLGVPLGNASDVAEWLGRTADGELRWVSKGSGGPIGSGEFAWPFPLAFVTREYGPGYPEYEDGVHKGIDFSGGPAVAGAPIPASSSGTVIAKAYDDERGNYIILSHGSRGGYELTTRYYHLNGSSPLGIGDTVVKGQTVGVVGSTGMSSGAHLHFETRRNGEHMNPRSFMEMYGE